MLCSDKCADFSDFIKPLKLKYPVDVMGYINTARYKLSKRSYGLIIIEIRMPTLGEFSLQEARDGAITGIIWFIKELASLKIPVLFWSYLDADYYLEIEKLKEKYPDNKIDLIWRDNSNEDHLLDGVEKFLNSKK